MSEEMRKIAGACFVGGAVCVSGALLVAPALWWLGALAGACAGYVAYDFRAVLLAIPVAFADVTAAAVSGWADVRHVCRALAAWLRKDHPFLYTSVVLGFCTAVWLIWSGYPFQNPSANTWYGVTMIITGCTAFFSALAVVVLYLLALLGTEWDDSYSDDQPPSYANVYRWIALGVPHAVIVLGKGCWRLVGIVHSYKRTLCAVDGALGGLIALIIFAATASAQPSVGEYVMVILSGGAIGAVLGILCAKHFGIPDSSLDTPPA